MQQNHILVCSRSPFCRFDPFGARRSADSVGMVEEAGRGRLVHPNKCATAYFYDCPVSHYLHAELCPRINRVGARACAHVRPHPPAVHVHTKQRKRPRGPRPKRITATSFFHFSSRDDLALMDTERGSRFYLGAQ